MKIGIVVPFSWSFWGAVVEHAELQAAALEARGHDVRLVMGNDPPGQFTRALHPRVGRHGNPPPNVIPVGRSVIVPANGSLPNIVLSPRSIFRVRRVLERERFDVLHLHEPMTPAICVAVLALAKEPDRRDPPRLRRPRLDAARHARVGLSSGPRRPPHRRLASSARDSADRWLAGPWEVDPERRPHPREADPGGPRHTVVFAGRHEPRKGLHVLLRAWPEIHRRTGARLAWRAPIRSPCGCCSPGSACPTPGIDIVGFLSQDALTDLAALDQGAPRAVARRRELRDGADARFRVRHPGRRLRHRGLPRRRDARDRPLRPARRLGALVDAPSSALLADEPRRAAMGAAARRLRRGALRVAGHRAAARGDLRARRRRARPRRRPRGVSRSSRSRGTRGRAASSCSRCSCSRSLAIWWRGPDWNEVYHAFDFVSWRWVVAGDRPEPALRARAPSHGDLTIHQALPPPQPPFRQSSRRSASGCSATPCCPPARASSRASPCSAVISRTARARARRSLGTVFAHRLFDLFPISLLVVYVMSTAKLPHWAVTGL